MNARKGLEGGFKVAPKRSNVSNLVITIFQAACFWSCFLVALPALLIWIEITLGFHPMNLPFSGWVSLAICILGFGLCASLNLWAGFTMSWFGKGTPLPLQSPRLLVVVGPYRFVRNPMALGGLGMCFFIGLAFGSYLTTALPFLAALIWHVIARPPEEADLRRRFGESYVEYSKNVRNWIPRATPFISKT